MLWRQNSSFFLYYDFDIQLDIIIILILIYFRKINMSAKRDRDEKFQIDEKTLDYKKIVQKDNDISQKGERMQQERKFLKILPPVSEEIERPILAPLFKFQGKKPIENQTQSKKQGVQEKTDAMPKQKDPESNKEEQKQKKSTQSFNSIFGDCFKQRLGLFTQNHTQNHTPNYPSTPTISFFNFGGEKKIQRNLDLFKRSSQSLFYTHPPQEKINQNQKKGDDKSKKKQSQEKQKIKDKQLKGKGDGSNAQDEEGSDEYYEKALQKQQTINLDPTKSTGKYEYSKECEILFESKAMKMKKQNSEVIEDIHVILQEDPETKKSWVLIKLVQTKVRILTGLILKGISTIKNFGGKPENVMLSILKIKKDQKPEKEIIKIQFEKPEQSKKFIETIQNIIS